MATDLKRNIGLRLRSIRKARGLTQEQVAEAIERTVETVSNIERGNSLPSLLTLESICRALACSMADIVMAQYPSDEKRIAAEAVAIDQLRKLSDDDFAVAAKTIDALMER